MRRIVALLILSAVTAQARTMVVYRFASPPAPVVAGQRFSLCAANVGVNSADIKLQFINVRTGEIVVAKDVLLPPPGSGRPMPNPCLSTTAEVITAAGSAPPGGPLSVVGVMILRSGLFSRSATATASILVYGPGATETLSVPLHLATTTNGRNTPLERVP